MNDWGCDYAGSILLGTIYLDGTISVLEEDARCDKPAAFEGVLPPTEGDPEPCFVKTCLEHLAEYEAEGLLDKRPLRIATSSSHEVQGGDHPIA